MEIQRRSGIRNSWLEMDVESRQAVCLAERLVEGKRGVVLADGERVSKCKLRVVYGCNIYNTQINIIDRDGGVIAFFHDGYFYDGCVRERCELF